jgi:KUP system potassium uptake protein
MHFADRGANGSSGRFKVDRGEANGNSLAKLSLAALGVVFGDIGTSPLYAIRECFHGEYGIPVVQENILS